MITEINIKNFKSIVDLTLPLSNINVFIGENGCGKTNILEAVGFTGPFDDTNLYAKGIRGAKPSLILNAFSGQKIKPETYIHFRFEQGGYTCKARPANQSGGYSEWVSETVDNDVARIGNEKNKIDIERYLIYSLNTTALRGFSNDSLMKPLGINGESLDILISTFLNGELLELQQNAQLIDWLEEVKVDKNNELKFQGFKPGRSTSLLYFEDKYMSKKNNIFSAENANEGILHILFYIALLISDRTPRFFGIDNIENGLNPKLCRTLMKKMAELAIAKNKQALITTHNPAVLDGLNLHDDRQRLFVVKRNDEGHTQIERIKLKPDANGEQLKLSELWMRGYLGAIPNHF
jgi:AAA15 family ATPase/GTPase